MFKRRALIHGCEQVFGNFNLIHILGWTSEAFVTVHDGGEWIVNGLTGILVSTGCVCIKV